MDNITDLIDEKRVLPKTSPPSTEDFMTKFEEVKEKGYDRIIMFTLSANLGETFNVAVVAANTFNENNVVSVEVYDSKNIAMSAGFVIREVVRYMKEVDYEIDAKVIQDIIDFYAEHSKPFMALETLDYLSYGGKIAPTMEIAGNIFGIKPLLICDEGKIKEFTKVRNSKRVLKIINNEFEKVSYDNGYLCIGHNNNLKDAKKLEKYLLKAAGDIKILPTAEIGPVMAVNTGPEVVVVGWGPQFF